MSLDAKRRRTDVGRGSAAHKVSRVEVTLATPASDYQLLAAGTDFSCQGRSRDDDRSIKIRAQAVRSAS